MVPFDADLDDYADWLDRSRAAAKSPAPEKLLEPLLIASTVAR